MFLCFCFGLLSVCPCLGTFQHFYFQFYFQLIHLFSFTLWKKATESKDLCQGASGTDLAHILYGYGRVPHQNITILHLRLVWRNWRTISTRRDQGELKTHYSVELNMMNCIFCICDIISGFSHTVVSRG